MNAQILTFFQRREPNDLIPIVLRRSPRPCSDYVKMPIAKQWFSVVRTIKNPKEKEDSSVTIEPKDFRKFGQYKFVRFDNGQVKFCVTTDMFQRHKDIVDEHPEWKPISAGKIQVSDGRWNIADSGSTSANLSWLEDDEDVIQKNLGDKFRRDPNLMPW